MCKRFLFVFVTGHLYWQFLHHCCSATSLPAGWIPNMCSELLWSKTFSLAPCLTNRNPVYQMCIFSPCTRPLEWFMTVLTVINCLVTFMSTWDLFICYWYTNTVHSCSKLPTCMTGHSKLLFFYCIAVIIVVESLRSDCWFVSVGWEILNRWRCWRDSNTWAHQWWC